MDQVLLKRNKTLKKYWKSRGIFSVRKNGNRGFLRKCTLHVQRMHFTNICVMDIQITDSVCQEPH